MIHRAATWHRLVLLIVFYYVNFNASATRNSGPFVVDWELVGRVLANHKLEPVAAQQDGRKPRCCSTNYSVAYDPSGNLLAVAIDNLLCKDDLKEIRRQILDVNAWWWETPEQAWARVHDPDSINRSRTVYSGKFPGVTASARDPEARERLLLAIRRCIRLSLPTELVSEYYASMDAKVALPADIRRLPIHADDESDNEGTVVPNLLVPINVFAASASTAPNDMLPQQSAPHVDGYDGLASVMTLSPDIRFEDTGTVLMQYKPLNGSRIKGMLNDDTTMPLSSAEKRQKIRLVQRRLQRVALEQGLPVSSGWVNSTETRFAKTVLRIPNKCGRITLYPQNHPHTAYIPSAEKHLSVDPKHGRLTLNIFWGVGTSRSFSPDDTIEGSFAHETFCMYHALRDIRNPGGLSQSEKDRRNCERCVKWRDCMWREQQSACLPSFDYHSDVDSGTYNREAVRMSDRILQCAALSTSASDRSEEKMTQEDLRPATQDIFDFFDSAQKRALKLMRTAAFSQMNDEMHNEDLALFKDLMLWSNYRIRQRIDTELYGVPHQAVMAALSKSLVQAVYRMAIEGTNIFEVTDHEGMTPLHHAVLLGSPALVSFLLKVDSKSLSTRDLFGRNPVELAHSQGFVLDPDTGTMSVSERSSKNIVFSRNVRLSEFSSSHCAVDASRCNISEEIVASDWDTLASTPTNEASENLHSGDCDFRSITMTQKTDANTVKKLFWETSIVAQQPLMIRRGVYEDNLTWSALTEWTPQKLKAVMGNRYVRDFSSTPYIVSQLHRQEEEIAETFEEYLEASAQWNKDDGERQRENPSLPPKPPPKYWFQSVDQKFSDVHQYLKDDIQIPSVLRELMSGSADSFETNKTGLRVQYEAVNHDFYHGVRTTRAPMHAHIAAWNALIFGEKIWSVHPPSRSFNEVLNGDRYSDGQNGAPASAPLRCTQRAGDILFLPRMWAHSVENIKESIGVAVQYTLNLN